MDNDKYAFNEPCPSNRKNDVNQQDRKSVEYYDNADTQTSFNSVTDHYNRIVGFPSKKVNLKILPTWLRIFYYFIFTIISIGSVLIIYAIIFND